MATAADTGDQILARYAASHNQNEGREKRSREEKPFHLEATASALPTLLSAFVICVA